MANLGETDRRSFLRHTLGSTLVAGGLALTGAGALRGADPAHAESDIDYGARETFDAWDLEFRRGDSAGQPGQPNDDATPSGSGALAWGQAYVLAGLVRMYEACRDPHYLDRLIENIDQVLAVRDSERGVTNHLGQSLPAWRANHPYTVGAVELADVEGTPVLEVRMGRTYCDTASVTVAPGSGPGYFHLLVEHGQSGSRQRFDDLTMDPSSPAYVVRRLYADYPGSVQVTARDLRTDPETGGEPLAGTYAMSSLPAIFAVHTGMITYPIASFVRLVRRSPTLRADPRYAAKAEAYLSAVREAVAVHDHEWRESENGEGYLVWVKGSPQPWDGCEQPINQSLGLGLTISELATITGESTYVHRARAMARMFRGQLMLGSNGTSTWHYWPTYGRMFGGYDKTGSPDTDVSLYNPSLPSPARQVEDVSHAAISVEFAVRAFRGEHGISGQDLARLAATFTRNVALVQDGAATTAQRVDGTGAPSATYAHQAPRWMPVAWWDGAVHDHALAVYDTYRPTPEQIGAERNGFGWLLAAVANFTWYARR